MKYFAQSISLTHVALILSRNRVLGEENRRKLGIWDEQTHTLLHKMDKEQGPIV